MNLPRASHKTNRSESDRYNMNTQAIATFLPATGAESAKSPTRDAAAPDTPFNRVLDREMADRQKNDASPARANKESTPAGKQETTASEKPLASKEAADRLTDTPTAEQMLMMAAQFASSNPTVRPANTDVPAAQSDETTLLTGVPASLLERIASETDTTGAGQDGALINAKPGKAGDAVNRLLDRAAGEKPSAPLLPDQDADLALPASVADTPEDFGSLMAQKSVAMAQHASGDAPDLTTVITPLQQAATALTDKVAGTHSNHIPSQVGSAAWNEAMGQKIVWMVGKGEQSASLTLNPPDLGPMQVVLSVSSTHANASFYSPHAEVRDALEAALPKLREMLGDAGLQLGQADVNAGSPQQQHHFAAPANPGRSGLSAMETAGLQPTSVTPTARIVREGLVDTFA
jgi:flagellar hook-length control protein FliK